MLKTEVKLSNLAYLIVYVKDTDKTKAWYRDILGLKIKVDSPDWVELETQGTTLALHKHDKMPAPTKREEGLPIAVFHVEDIYAAYEALKAKGIKFEKEPQVVCEGEGGKVGKSVDFTDPDGNKLSVFGYTSK
jgi:lactoylglutathione lyase